LLLLFVKGDPFGRAQYLRWENATTDQPSCRISTPGTSVAGCWCPLTRGPFQKWPLLSLWAYPQIPSSISRAFGCAVQLGPSVPSQTFVDWLVNNETAFGDFLDGLGGGLQMDWPYGTWPHCLDSTCDLHLRAHRYLGMILMRSSAEFFL
jgi:hypothetical protein